MVASHEYVENILATFNRASEANRNTSGRQGNLIALTPDLADEVMVTGDLHGHQQNFHRMRCVAALDENPRRHLVLQEVCHGGPIYPQSGGCRSHTILEDVALLKTQFPDRVHFILGNHELAEVTDYPIRKNKQMLNVLFQMGLQQMYGPAADVVRDVYRRFLKSCPLAVRLPQGVLISHSIPEDVESGRFNPSVLTRELVADDFAFGGDVFQLVWGRDYRGANARAFAALVGAKILINGHEPCYDGFIAPNDSQIILDCCGQRAAYLMLPVGPELTQDQMMERVQRL